MPGSDDSESSVFSVAGAGVPPRWTPLPIAEVAQLLPGYEVLALIGQGGMGAVYLALQTALDRSVAIKLIPLEISTDEPFAQRFVREARAMARLNHPHITAVHDFGKTAAGHLYFAMEFVDGENLQALIRGAGLAPAQALDIASQVCAALEYAHANGIVHRDIKPANVLVDRAGQIKVADFGIARFDEPGVAAFSTTQTGMVLGTPDYMAPEQMRGARVDHRADIYSLGVMLYEMLCGEVPRGVFAPASQLVACGTRVDAVVMKAMQQDLALRFQSIAAMQAALDDARLRLPRATAETSPRRSAAAFAAMVAGVLIVAGLVWAVIPTKQSSSAFPAKAAQAIGLAPMPPESDAAYARHTVEWLWRVGDNESNVQVRRVGDGSIIELRKGETLPDGDWEIVTLWADRSKAPPDLPPVTAREFVAHTSRLRQLRRFFARDLRLSDADFAFLANNAGLQSVVVEGIPVGDSVLAYFAGLKNLSNFEISNSPNFTGRRFSTLACLPGLNQVQTYGTGFSLEAVQALAGCPQLLVANLASTPLTDEGLRTLKACTSLERLYVENTKITDAGLAEVATWPKLKQLTIWNTPVSEAAILAFQAARPECVVLRAPH